MLHLLHGKLTQHGGVSYIDNDQFGIQVTYQGDKKKGTFFLYPQIDPNKNTINYYAFDHAKQKAYFEDLIKIQGIGGKSGYHIAMLPRDELEVAVEQMDVQFFQQIPGIGPKTAKRILLELKSTVSTSDMSKLNIDDQLYKDIISSLKSLGYEAKRVKSILPDCPIALKKEKLPDIMKWMIDHL